MPVFLKFSGSIDYERCLNNSTVWEEERSQHYLSIFFNQEIRIQQLAEEGRAETPMCSGRRKS